MKKETEGRQPFAQARCIVIYERQSDEMVISPARVEGKQQFCRSNEIHLRSRTFLTSPARRIPPQFSPDAPDNTPCLLSSSVAPALRQPAPIRSSPTGNEDARHVGRISKCNAAAGVEVERGIFQSLTLKILLGKNRTSGRSLVVCLNNGRNLGAATVGESATGICPREKWVKINK